MNNFKSNTYRFQWLKEKEVVQVTSININRILEMKSIFIVQAQNKKTRNEAFRLLRRPRRR